MRKLILSSIVGAALTFSTFSGAFAEGKGTNKSCPNEGTVWLLVEPEPGDEVFDRNGDGLICVKAVNGRGNSRAESGATVRDNLSAFTTCSCAREQDVAELNEI